jgi:amino acid transporter
MHKPESSAGGPRRQLSLLDATCIVVGIIIGSGIYKTTPAIAANVPSFGVLICVWLAGGLISLIGALCYAELATAFPHEGGDYVYLSRAFGRRAGFLFAWAGFWVIRPGNVGMMAFVFAEYAQKLWALPLGGDSRWAEMSYALAAVVVLTALNLLGVRSGKWTQNVLSIVKVAGLLAIFAVAAFWQSDAAGAAPPSPASGSSSGNLQLAMVLVLFTYGGWNDVAFVSAEVRRPERNILRCLLLGVAVVTLVYVLVNVAFAHVLGGITGVANSKVPAADTLERMLGVTGGRLMSALVCVSCLGAINGMLVTGARIYYALGAEHRLYAWLGTWNARFDAPLRSFSLQLLTTMALIAGFGSYAKGFDRLLVFSTPVFWAFIFMVGVSLFVLRFHPPAGQGVQRVPLYPWTPLAFCLSAAFLFSASFSHALTQDSSEAYWAIGLLAVGVILSFFDPPRGRTTK